MLQAALGSRHRRAAVGLRAVPAPPARGPPVRRRGRRRTRARRDRGVPLRRRGARRAPRARRRRRADAGVAGRLPLHRRHLGLRRGRGLLPLLPAAAWSRRRFAEAVLLETLLLSIYNHDSAIASAASRMTCAAGDRPCIEMGSRRTHEEAAVAAARAAYVAGFAHQLQPRGPAAVRRAHGRHQRAQLHAAARHRGARRSRAQVDSLGTRHHPAGRHLRHRRGGPAGGRGGRPRRSAPSASTPATSARWPTRCASSSTRWAPPTRGSS